MKKVGYSAEGAWGVGGGLPPGPPSSSLLNRILGFLCVPSREPLTPWAHWQAVCPRHCSPPLSVLVVTPLEQAHTPTRGCEEDRK